MRRIWLKINPHVVTLNPNGKTGSAVSLFGKLIYIDAEGAVRGG